MHGDADEIPGALAGDLYFRIMIDDHPDFGRKGADLLHLKKISLLQALTGVCFDLKLLDGTTIKIASAKGHVIHHGTFPYHIEQKKVIKRKGMPFYKDPMSKGNLIVVFEVQYPEKKQIMEKDYAKLAEIFHQPLNPEASNYLPESNFLEESQKPEDQK